MPRPTTISKLRELTGRSSRDSGLPAMEMSQPPDYYRDPPQLSDPPSTHQSTAGAEFSETSSASRPQAYDYPPSSSHPSGQTATDSFSPRSQNKSFLRRVLGKRSGNRDDPTATDEFGERSNPDASTASVFGKIREPGTGRPPTENWNPYGPIAEAIRKSITVSVSGAIMKEELDSGRQTNSVTSRQDEMAGHYRVLEEVHEELDTLLDLEDPQPTRERYLDCVREKSGNQDHDVRRHGRTWDKSVGRRARRDGWI